MSTTPPPPPRHRGGNSPRRPTNAEDNEIIDVTPIDSAPTPPRKNTPSSPAPTQKEPQVVSPPPQQADTQKNTIPSTPPPTTQPVTQIDVGLSAEAIASAQRLMDYIADDECSEVLLNGPNECSRKVRGARYHAADVAFHTKEIYHQVLNEYLLPHCETTQRIDGETVIVEGRLELAGRRGQSPMRARVHIVAPPGVREAKVTIAKQPRVEIGLDDMMKGGSVSPAASEFLKAIARGHKTFVVSGPTGAGKSTMLQAMTHHFDINDRVVVVEETPELRLPLGDVVYLKSSLEMPGMDLQDMYSLGFWVKQANRMRMDRVIVGETRGAELAEWLIAANSGADGSCTTVHSHSPRRTLDKMLTLASKDPFAPSEDQLRREIAATVDIIVQLGLLDDGRHVVTAIEEISNTVTGQTGQIQSNTLFEFDRTRNAHVAAGRPSDDLTKSLARQGIALDPNWFQRTN